MTVSEALIRSRHYAALDGLRGVAILLVFARHAFLTRHIHSVPAMVLGWVGTGGWLGVDLFFVLSGFLITGILLDSVDRERYFRNFYIRRTLRIFPLFYGVLLFCWLLTPLLHLQWRLGHLALLFYCQNIAVNIDSSLRFVHPALNVEHFWSLAVEEQFYLIWPFAVWLLRDPKKVFTWCVSLAGIAFLLRLSILHWWPTNNAQEWIYSELPTHGDGLLLGASLAAAIRQWPISSVRRYYRWPTLVFAGVFVAVVATSRTLDFHSAPMGVFGYTASAFLFSGLLLSCLDGQSTTAGLFASAPLRFLGRYSYGIYVYHLLFTGVTTLALYWLQERLHSVALGAAIYLVLWFGASVAIAVLSYELFEVRFVNLKDRLAPASPRSERAEIKAEAA